MVLRQEISALFTDLYEVTMAQAYWAEGMSSTAVFETFFRKLPPGRSYLLAGWSPGRARLPRRFLIR